MKVGVIFSTYNKNVSLSNTLYSISQQQTNFPFEVCIVDDASAIDPEPIIRQFLPNAKYLRLLQHVGFIHAPNKCLDLLSPDVDVVVIMSCDVMMLQTSVLQRLCERVVSKKVVFAEVLNLEMSPFAYAAWDKIVEPVLGFWDFYLRNSVQQKRALQTTRYNSTSWLFFLGAIMRQDLVNIGFYQNSCDAVLAPIMKRAGFQAELLTHVRGLHQFHAHVDVPCPLSGSCSYHCCRTKQKPDVVLTKEDYKCMQVL